MLEAVLRAQTQVHARTVGIGVGWMCIFLFMTQKGRNGLKFSVHDPYLSLDENSVKLRVSPIDIQHGNSIAKAPITMDNTDYERMVIALQPNEITSRPRF